MNYSPLSYLLDCLKWEDSYELRSIEQIWSNTITNGLNTDIQTGLAVEPKADELTIPTTK